MKQPTMPELNTPLNSKEPVGPLSASRATALVERVRATPGWWGHLAGDLGHRYLFVWRWWEPSTAILFVYHEDQWRRLRIAVEAKLGPGHDPRRAPSTVEDQPPHAFQSRSRKGKGST